LGGRKGIRPVKTEWWGAGVVVCLEQGADLHMAQLMPLPLTVSSFSTTILVLPFCYRLTWVFPETYIHPFNGPFSGTTQVGRYQKGKTNLDFPRKRAVKLVCVCKSHDTIISLLKLVFMPLPIQ